MISEGRAEIIPTDEASARPADSVRRIAGLELPGNHWTGEVLKPNQYLWYAVPDGVSDVCTLKSVYGLMHLLVAAQTRMKRRNVENF